MFATAGADRAIRIWKHTGSTAFDNDLDDYLKEDGKPDYEMLDEHHPSPVKPL